LARAQAGYDAWRRRRRMVATRRACSAAVGACASGEQGNGAGLGWRGARQAEMRARPASAVGREAERRPVKRNEILFFLFLK